MADPELARRLRALSAERLGVGEAELTERALLGDDLGVDSLAAIEWGMSIEDTFGITLPEDAWSETYEYGQVEALVERAVSGVRR